MGYDEILSVWLISQLDIAREFLKTEGGMMC